MKNFFKKINVLGLALILVGSLTIGIQSAFKSNSLLNTYYYDPVSQTWKPLTRTLQQNPGDDGYEPNTYRCESNTDADCTGEFDSTASELPGSAIPDGTIQPGVYTAN
jgi:hypothetical protein